MWPSSGDDKLIFPSSSALRPASLSSSQAWKPWDRPASPWIIHMQSGLWAATASTVCADASGPIAPAASGRSRCTSSGVTWLRQVTRGLRVAGIEVFAVMVGLLSDRETLSEVADDG